jgi:hypothetical protein
MGFVFYLFSSAGLPFLGDIEKKSLLGLYHLWVKSYKVADYVPL